MKKLLRYGAFVALFVSALALGVFTKVVARTININRNDVDAAIFDAARSDAASFDRVLPLDAGLRDALKRDALARDAIRRVNSDPIAIDDGYTAVNCSNLSPTAVYFGDPDVSAANGFPICSAATCASSVIEIEAYHGVVYAVTSSSSDAGVNIVCIAGH